jgi:hypothetical protein
MKLIFIHGRAQQGKDPVALRQSWIATWEKGLQKNNLSIPAGLTIAFPFYGDLLEELVQQADLPADAEEALSKGSAEDEANLVFFNDFLQEMMQNGDIPESEANANYEGDIRDKGPLNWGWVQAILKTLDKTPLGNLSIKKFTYDAYLYLTIPAIKRKINELVAKHFDPDPCVVVGHSLGSAVGYTLLSANPAWQVKKYLTVGSPLGLRSFTNRLAKPLAMPGCVAHGWFNAYDERDVVALQPLDDQHFGINPAITNYNQVRNHTDNRHGIEGYLDDAVVAKAIYEALGL